MASSRDNRRRTISARQPMVPSQEDTFDDLEESLILDAQDLIKARAASSHAIIDRSGRLISFKGGSVASRSSDSEENNAAILGLRNASSPGAILSERDWSRSASKRKYDLAPLGTSLGKPGFLGYPRGDPIWLPRTRPKSARRSIDKGRPVLGGGHSHGRPEAPLGRHGPLQPGRPIRGTRYASSGTQTAAGTQVSTPVGKAVGQPTRNPEQPGPLVSSQPPIVNVPDHPSSTSTGDVKPPISLGDGTSLSTGSTGTSHPVGTPQVPKQPDIVKIPEVVKQPGDVSTPQVLQGVQPVIQPQSQSSPTALPVGSQTPATAEPKTIAAPSPSEKPVTGPPETAPVSSLSPAPILPVKPSVPLEQLYMLTSTGHDNQWRDSFTGTTSKAMPQNHVSYTGERTSSQDFLVKLGPMLFEESLETATSGSGICQLAASDNMRRHFTVAWQLSQSSSASSNVSYLQSFGVKIQPSADKKSFEIVDINVKVAKDSKTTPLEFSARAAVLNQEFEDGFPQRVIAAEGTGSAGASNVPDIRNRSGFERYPGHLLMGLEISPENGGFKTLGDLCAVAGLKPASWINMLLTKTNIKFGSLAGTPARNAMWYFPDSGATCCIRLEAAVDLSGDIVKELNKYLSGWNNAMPAFSAIAKRTVVPTPGPWGDSYALGELVLAAEPQAVAGEPHALGAYVSFSEDQIKLMLVCYSANLQWSTLKDWFKKNCGEAADAISKLETTLGSTGHATSSQSKADNNLSHIYWRKVTVTLSSDGKNTVLSGLRLELEACLQVLVPKDKHSVFTMVFAWNRGGSKFSGGCSFDGVGNVLGSGEPPLQYLLDYERWNNLTYLVPSEPYMSLRQFDSEISQHLPFGIPTEITEADLYISDQSLTFQARLRALVGKPTDRIPNTASGVPQLQIDDTMLSVALNINYAASPKTVSVGLLGSISFFPLTPGGSPAMLDATITYESANSHLKLTAGAQNFPMAVLHSLFSPGDEKTQAMTILEHITLQKISLTYESSKGKAPAISFEAGLDIGGFLLTTKFLRIDAENWTFDSKFEPKQSQAGQASKQLELGVAVKKLLGPDVADLLPDFVNKTQLTSANPEKDKFTILCKRVNEPKCLVFGAGLQFGMLQVQFAQIAPIAGTQSGEKSASEKGGNKSSVKRMIRVSLGPLPSIPKLPVVGELDIPFNELEFLWVSTAVTQDDVNVLNKNITAFQSQPLVLSNGSKEIAEGFHFRLVGSKGVFLDHIFEHKTEKKTGKDEQSKTAASGPATKDSQKPSVQAPAQDKPTDTSVVPSGGSSAATTAALDEKKGPLKLSGISVSYDGGALRIHLDADVLIGPIGAGVQGLTLVMDLKSESFHGLHDLLHIPIKVEIEGFDMSFDRSPVMLAGALHHKPGSKAYLGGIAISLKALSIAALGMYDEVAATENPPVPAYDSFFVYAILEGLIFTVGWAEIRGLIAGFGYNSRLRLPSVDQLSTFPLLQGFGTPGGFSINSAVKNLTGPGAFVTPSRGSIWMALGLIIRACEAIDMRAVATVALGPNQTEIGLLARATASLPRGSPPEHALVLIDLSVVGKLDLYHGELAVDGLINPTSFILSKDCRPQGGFAIRSWFGKDNPHDGDWVVSFGGYHPMYQVPAHYPVPQRLGISWTLSSNLRVTGNAYAAVTPGAIMAGGLLQAVFSAGPIGAHFDAHADFLVNLKPLHYQADMAVSAGVYYEIRVWMIRKKISVNIGASLHLEGPPVHGSVHFDLTVVRFNVSFGSGSGQKVEAISLSSLMELVLQQSAENKDKNGAIKNPHTFTAVSGLLGDDSKKPDAAGTVSTAPSPKAQGDKERWTVRSDNLVFQVRSPVPITEARLDRGGNFDVLSGGDIISRPMQMKKNDRNKITSTFDVKVCPVKGGTKSLAFKAASRIYDQLPANYWGEYSTNTADYMHPGTMPPTVKHLVGMTVIPPPAAHSEKSMPVFKSVAENYNEVGWIPKKLEKKSTSYVDDNDSRESVKWSRVRTAMLGGTAKIQRVNILDQFIKLSHPGNDPKSMEIQAAYRRIGSASPAVILQEPERFYNSPPTVFCN